MIKEIHEFTLELDTFGVGLGSVVILPNGKRGIVTTIKRIDKKEPSKIIIKGEAEVIPLA
ncbi:hypothetical protein ACERII_05560 [Evansella sp. AB-rgal1]|uniref:hypothetical protein n=1 Tax=Evansella sp. AB-rgal1 TaxID=3242696 RepID=UPI00359D5014